MHINRVFIHDSNLLILCAQSRKDVFLKEVEFLKAWRQDRDEMSDWALVGIALM